MRVALLTAVGLLVMACSSGKSGDRPGAPPPAPTPPPGERARVTLLPAGKPPAEVQAEVVRSDADRARGLMHREHLDADAGMLFVFEEEEPQTFWMKNTLIPLDMIFIAADLTVVGVVENAEPLSLRSRGVSEASLYVLEVNGGWARTHGVGAGTRVRIDTR